MKKTATALVLTGFERELGSRRESTVTISTGATNTYFLETVTDFTGDDDSVDTTLRLTRREMIELGQALMETAGASNISYTYSPLAEEEE